jgi:hypothetical protein
MGATCHASQREMGNGKHNFVGKQKGKKLFERAFYYGSKWLSIQHINMFYKSLTL